MTPKCSKQVLPGSWLKLRAERYFERPILETLVLPIIGDLQHEYLAAPANAASRAAVLLRGYWSFWKAMGLHLLIGLEERMRKTILVILVNILALLIFWIAGLLLVRLGYKVTPNNWIGPVTGQLLGCLVGVVVALALRARLTAYFLVGMVAYSASEQVVHMYFGNQAAQGAPTHVAVMGAAVLGVLLGALLAFQGGRFAARIRTRSSAAPPGDPSSSPVASA